VPAGFAPEHPDFVLAAFERIRFAINERRFAPALRASRRRQVREIGRLRVVGHF